MLECVVNISEGARPELIADIGATAGSCLLDVHSDPDHNRSVFTLVGPDPDLWDAVTNLARRAVELLDLRAHTGVHPRSGVVDVVPWVDLDEPWAPATPRSIDYRDRFASWATAELQVPCELYGPERTLPEARRAIAARRDAHPTAGVIAVGARGVLVAYNLWLRDTPLATARSVASALRRPGIRALGLQVGDRVQVSCNLTDPSSVGPADVYDLVAQRCTIDGAELVGLVPRELLDAVPADRWAALDLSPEKTIRR